MKKVVIVIPVYRIKPSESEELSFRCVLRVCGSRDISLVIPESFDSSYYQQIAKEEKHGIGEERFKDHFFTSVEAYNSLCLDKKFYHRYLKYEYMLLYQLDAYIFRDDLNIWCEKGYDYVGAPWPVGTIGNMEPIVGNGGFSLRKNALFYELLAGDMPRHNVCQSYRWFRKHYGLKGYGISKSIFMSIFRSLGYKNTWSYYLKSYQHEDMFFCEILKALGIPLSIPDENEASLFALELNGPMYFKKNGCLPMGCHAWDKYDKEFWSKFI